MQVTTYGETHKEFLSKNFVEEFLKKEKKSFIKLTKNTNVFYDSKTVVSDVALNYLNLLPECSGSESLKNILVKEYYSCEKIYPYLGDYFLHKFFQQKIKKSNSFIFEKRRQKDFLISLDSQLNKNIAQWIFENINLNRSVNVKTYSGKDVAVECSDEFVFDIDYDTTIFKTTKDPVKNYKYVIINGIIESVGEIHHLLYKANETKIPHVIFCCGISEEVKTTIVRNNMLGRFKVYPVCLNVNDENSLNILNDIAAIHGGDIISSDLGQTISQEVRKDLNMGEKINFSQMGIEITPGVCQKSIESHRKFLRKRIDDAIKKTDVKIEPLKNRLKMFTGKKVNLYIPEMVNNNKKNMRELDYFLRFVSCLSLIYRIINIGHRPFYLPECYINIADDKVKSLKDNFKNISVIILGGENAKK